MLNLYLNLKKKKKFLNLINYIILFKVLLNLEIVEKIV